MKQFMFGAAILALLIAASLSPPKTEPPRGDYWPGRDSL